MTRLRIGLITKDLDRIEPWGQRLIAYINSDKNLDVAGFIVDDGMMSGRKTNSFLSGLIGLEAQVFARPKPLDPILQDANNVAENIVLASDPDAIDELALDIIIDLDCSGAGPFLASVARHGVWYLDLCALPKGLGGFWEASGKTPVSTITLCWHPKRGAKPQTIATGTVNSKFIASRNLLFMKEKSIALILRELRKLQRNQTVHSEGSVEVSLVKSPSPVEILKYIGWVINNLLLRSSVSALAYTGFRPDMFILKVGVGTALDFDPAKTTEIMPTGNNYWADPFLWERDGAVYCFFETYNYKTQHGHISVGRLDGDELTVLGKALVADYHLSFPFLFEDEGELYMLPETNEARRIEIWRCVEFPLGWERHSTALLGANAADTTLLKQKNKWWLFTNIASDVFGDNCSELHVFEVDGPNLQKVVPHQFNPVVFDARSARNAGRPQIVDGRILRPSQDNAYGRYGYGLNIMEIKEIGLDRYSEESVRHITPEFESGTSGCHHFDVAGGRFVIDIQRKVGGRGR